MQTGHKGIDIHQELVELLKGTKLMANVYPPVYDVKQYKRDFLRG